MIRSKLLACSWVLVTWFGAQHALAQSAADKATARKLATEGIELHGQGKYVEALDKLQRAEALYDAPVHLLYIARTQGKLNQFVEASETYRRLMRVQLEPGAPPAFRDAVEAAKREVGEVEAKIGSLRVEVEPANLPGLELTIDGQKVSSAAVGVERPINPGRHTVSAVAPGYRAAEDTVQLGEAEKKGIKLTLVADPTAPPPSDTTAGAAALPDAQGAPPSADAVPPQPAGPERGDVVSVLLGLRFGGVIPGGSVFNTGSNAAMSDYFGAGAGGELYAGAWVLRHFGAKLYFEAQGFQPGAELDRIDDLGFEATVTNQATAQGVGFALMGGTKIRDWGVYGELGFTFSQKYEVTREFESRAPDCGEQFDQTLSLSGTALRIGAAGHLPVAKFLELSPFVHATFGKFGKLENDSSCTVLHEHLGSTANPLPPPGDLTGDAQSGHSTIVLGVGGDFLIGVR